MTDPLGRTIDRRAFLGASAAVAGSVFLAACGGGSDGGGAAATSTTSSAPVSGATPAERAVNALRALELPSDFSITVFSEDLSIKAAEVTAARFREQTGIALNIQKAPVLEYIAKVFNDATRRSGTYDVVLIDANRLGDLSNAGYVTDLTEWVEKYDPGLDDMINPQATVWSMYNGRYVALPTDGDVYIFYYRRDLLEDPAERRAFEARYGRELAVPTTYDEYNEVLEFFTRPDEKLYGAVEWRVKGVTHNWFFERLWSAGGTYFNDDMSAAINSPEGVRALEDLKAMERYMPPDALSYGYIETVEAMANGTAFSNITWPAAAKNVSSGKTAGKWGYATVPGYVVDGRPNPKSLSGPGISLVVNSNSSKDKEALYLYCQWLVSPENLQEAVRNPEGNTDPIRISTFEDEGMVDLLPGGATPFLEAAKQNLEIAVPQPILPGSSEYLQSVEIAIQEHLTGGKGAQEALDEAAKAWDEITDGFGREQQLEAWRAFLDIYNA